MKVSIPGTPGNYLRSVKRFFALFYFQNAKNDRLRNRTSFACGTQLCSLKFFALSCRRESERGEAGSACFRSLQICLLAGNNHLGLHCKYGGE
jgi:hypothetical protein